MSERDRAKDVQDGEVKILSASIINAFDKNTAFGCERRFWFNYVGGEREPETGNQTLGKAVHQLVEDFLNKTIPPPVEPDPVQILANEIFADGLTMVQRVAKKTLFAERKFKTELDGTPLWGECDVVTTDGIVDWKTTKSLKYAKPHSELMKDSQMIIYSQVFHPTLPEVKLAHGYFQTSEERAHKLVEVAVTRAQVDSHFNNYLLPLVRKMKNVVKVEDPFAVDGDDRKCFRCPFKLKCSEHKTKDVMSIFKSQAAKEEPKPTPNYSSIVPPDAPKSNPSLAAEPLPVETVAATKKRGRQPKQQELLATEKETGLVKFEFETVSVTRGATLNMGNYNSTKLEITASARFSGSPEEAYEKVNSYVTRKLSDEVAVINSRINTKEQK